MSKITEVRLTLAAFIYGVEIDLKNVLKRDIAPYQGNLAFLGDRELETRVVSRFQKENIGVDYVNCIEDLIDFLDFGDTFMILKKNEALLRSPVSKFLDSIYQDLVAIVPVRNRVMHTRPLLGGDFMIVYDFISKLRHTDPIEWKATIETKELIERDPFYVLTLKIPSISYESQNNKIIHNLPVPDFDETGFIGRAKDVDDIKKLIFTNRVVTVLGDGGIGKTALALKVAYDIVDLNEKSPFDLIIWTTAKTTMLTSKGIEEIYTAITDYTGLISEISKSLDPTVKEDKLATIIEYLDIFRTLIIIDNLETIHSEEVRDFIRQAQVKAHILITSRIGLGELEFPRKLNGLTENESAKLVREIARIRNSETLIKLPQKTLVEISEKLYFNPLALKWFVSTVEMGISPSVVLNNKDNLLNFCLTNVYEKLSEGSVSILNTIRASRKKLTTGEIIYLSGFEPIDVRRYLIELFKTTLISREIVDANNLEDVFYLISDFAKDFLAKNYQISHEYVKMIARKYKALEESLKDIKKIDSYNEFLVNALSFETSNQKIAAKFLSEALAFSKIGKYASALQRVNEAKNIEPNYYEVYRVGAFIKATQGDILSAEEDYQLGLEIAPDNLRLLYYYAQFLLFSLEDCDKALTYAQRVYEQEPTHPYSVFLFARCYNSMKEFDKAIEIISNLVSTVELDAKNKRVAYTELISLNCNAGQSLFRIETDVHRAIDHYKRAFEFFTFCANNNIIDYKLLKNFVEGLHNFIKDLPTTEIDSNKVYIRNFIQTFHKQITLTHISHKVLTKYADKFEDYSFNYLLDNSDDSEKRLGYVSKYSEDTNYVFIEAENERVYANRYDFIDVLGYSDWKKIKNGRPVSFQVGTNPQGTCAKNIKLLDEIS